MNAAKKKPEDFVFGRLLGEGSFSQVMLAKEVDTNRLFAVKVCSKQHILREKKSDAVKREKEVLSRCKHSTIIRLYCTFQDAERLYFVMEYAKGGELLKYMRRVGSFTRPVAQFFAAQILTALEFMHQESVIHRDLKPENVLLDEHGLIRISDFGSAKIIAPPYASEEGKTGRRNSFVGTAQYVSPEMLQGRPARRPADLWAFGCFLYQMLAGYTPFRGTHEYEIFQKITKIEYEFPDGDSRGEPFDTDARHLIASLIVEAPQARLGAEEPFTDYDVIRQHRFFAGLDWSTILDQSAVPACVTELMRSSICKAEALNGAASWNERSGYDDQFAAELLSKEFSLSQDSLDIAGISLRDEEGHGAASHLASVSDPPPLGTLNIVPPPPVDRQTSATNSERSSWSQPPTPDVDVSRLPHYDIRRSFEDLTQPVPTDSRSEQLLVQAKENEFHRFVEGNLILKQGIMDKRVGLRARRRMFLLTDGPHLYYVDPVNMELKGEVPWSPKLKPKAKSFRQLEVRVPGRTYHLEDPTGYALKWAKALEQVRDRYYGHLLRNGDTSAQGV